MPDASLPIIDVSGRPSTFASAIDAACRDHGFFAVTGHGIDPTVTSGLREAARAFFALPLDAKQQVAMPAAGAAWRGWFPFRGELTSGEPDDKEGFYVGEEGSADGRPLHGSNLWPDALPALRPIVERYVAAAIDVGHHVLAGMAVGLGLDESWFRRNLTATPTVLFRMFRYPPTQCAWGVGEHTDYGLLTLLLADDVGGLEVRGADGWRQVPPLGDALVCNLGDMLDRMTGGRYRSTPHRVANRTDRERYSFPLFLDPGWDVEVTALPLEGPAPADDADSRWDGTSLQHLSGTYGDYLTAKVARVFPELFDAVI